MAVVIRLKRTGRRNRPCYRISVADSRWKRDGRTLETLGLYDPVSPKEDSQSTVNVERARYWLGTGAQASETVHTLFKRHGVYEEAFTLGTDSNDKARKARRRPTKTKTRRRDVNKMRADRKSLRQTERIGAKRAAAKAAKAAEATAEA